MEGDKTLKLTLKQNSGQQFEITIKAQGTTVLDLKQACTEPTKLTVEEIRLIYKGTHAFSLNSYRENSEGRQHARGVQDPRWRRGAFSEGQGRRVLWKSARRLE